MNIWIESGDLPAALDGMCRLRRLTDGDAPPVTDLRADDFATAMARLAAASGQGNGFAVASDDRAVMLAAIAMGASDIVVSDSKALDIAALNRVAAARRQATGAAGTGSGSHAPAERERCLTVRRALIAGAVIGEDDLDVALTDYRGLGPSMGKHVVGLRLRYAVSPGEALHFGHFHDRHAD